MPLFLAPIINSQQEDANGAPLNAGTVEIYLAGSSTPVASYSDQAGLIANTSPIVLNTLGLNSQGAVWLPGGVAYKLVIKNEFGLVQRTIDNVSGINDTTVTVDQWIPYPGPPTYISATSFSVVGDQTQSFQVGRRIKSVNTAGTVYSTITASTYGAPNTIVTVVNDSGVLDAGLSQVSYGLISPLDGSLPGGRLLNVRVFSTAGTATYTKTPGTTSVVVEVQAGGGAGGGTPATAAGTVSAAGGGQGGGYAKGRFTSGFDGVTVTVGAAGAGAAGAVGGAGGTSSFGALLSVSGGAGGQVGFAVSTPALSGSTGASAPVVTGTALYILPGGAGGTGIVASTVSFEGGAGGNSAFGGGNTLPGGAYSAGAGGGGRSAGTSSGAAAGYAGGRGTVVVWEYA